PECCSVALHDALPIFIGSDRTGQALLDPRAAKARRHGVGLTGLAASESKEGLERREFASRGDIADSISTARGELGPQIGRAEAREGGPVFGFEPVEPARRGCQISTHRMGGPA